MDEYDPIKLIQEITNNTTMFGYEQFVFTKNADNQDHHI